jgi:hypothetical protein
MRQNPAVMSFDAIIGEITSLKGSMQRDGRRVYELSRILQDRVRRQGTDDYTARYLTYSNACIRFCGILEQGLQRASSFDRVMVTVRKAQAKAAEIESKVIERPKAPQAQGLGDLTALFGQEMINAST